MTPKSFLKRHDLEQYLAHPNNEALAQRITSLLPRVSGSLEELKALILNHKLRSDPDLAIGFSSLIDVIDHEMSSRDRHGESSGGIVESTPREPVVGMVFGDGITSPLTPPGMRPMSSLLPRVP